MVAAKTNSTSRPVLEYLDVGVRYDGSIVASNVSFAISRGETVCVLGPSGCGKSSLVRMAAGLQQPSFGRILFHGREVTRPSHSRAMVFQDDALLPWRSVLDNVALPLELLRKSRGQRREAATRALGEVGLSSGHELFPRQLSGGMRQRVQLARALLSGPDLLLLDEPFSALDYVSRSALQELVSRVRTEHELAVILVSHDIREALIMADHIVVLGGCPSRMAATYDRGSCRLEVWQEMRGDPLVRAFCSTLEQTITVLDREIVSTM